MSQGPAPQVSVIIPTRNREAFLQEAVASVVKQRNVSFEILVVNDGAALDCRFDDERIRVLDNSQRGAVPARNLGVAEARGEYIALLDDDDWFIDDAHLARAVVALVVKKSDFTFSNGVMYFPDGREKIFDHRATAKTLERDNTILVSAICYRRSLHQVLGTFDAALPWYWDWDWYLRVARGGLTLHHERSASVAIRVHDSNMSGRNEDARSANLKLLETKHGLAPIPLKSHVDFV